MFFTECVSGMLIDSLRDDYTESKCSFDEDEWPPNQPKTVVNVALIHYKGSRTEQELIEISKRYKEGALAVDELSHHSRVTKDISKIFQPDFTNTADAKPLKLILIEGAPGIGKTVLAKRIAYLWAKKELLTDVNILFLLFLRDPELQNIKTTEQLIQYLSSKSLDEEEVKNCVQQVKELHVGIVMDGFDEYPIQLRKRSFIADLIRGKVFHNCTIVLTSRPNATINLHDKVDRRVEILGFAQEERDVYISESLESPKQRKQLQGYLKCQPIINGLVYVPLHLAVLLYLFKIQIKLPETLTEMNESFILHTIYRSLTKNKLIPTAVVTAIESIKDLPEYVINIVNGLSKLAFMGLQNNRLVFTYREIKATCPEIEKDIPGAINGFGLLQVVQHFSKRGAGTTVSFNFLHFTMQEFLAAFHVSDSTKISYEQQISLMEKTFWKGIYCFMWMMYVGINGVNSRTFIQFLYKGQPDTNTGKLKLSSSVCNDKIKALHLFQCFMEAKSEKVPKEISNIFYNNEINFKGLRLLPHHISSLILYMSKYSMQLEILNLRDCHIGDVGMSILEHYFTANKDKASSIKQIDLFGNNSVLLWNVHCAIFGHQKLTKLNWASLRGVNVEEILTVMDKNTTVQSLNLSENCFNDNDAERIAEVLSNNTTLKELDFSKNKITTKGAIAISDCVCNNVKLQHLKISWNNHFMDTDHPNIDFSQRIISNTDTQIVTKLLCKSETVTKLDLSQNRISDIGVGSISMCIESARSLREMDISRNKISNVGLKKITDALQLNRTVKKLNISHNKISDSGLSAIGECLKSNSTLQEVNMSYNNISSKGIVAFSDYLKDNIALTKLTVSWNTCETPLVLDGTNVFWYMSSKHFGDVGTTLISAFLWHKNIIQKLDISNNYITDNGAVAISDYLKNASTLQELNISHNKISSGMMNIFKALQMHAALQKIDISHNNITDDGVIAISEYLKNNSTLQELNISHNKISSGMTNIFKALQMHATLQILDISRNNITDEGAIAISECLKNNNTLQKLDISYNQVSDVIIINILEFLHINTMLQVLVVSHNNITDNGAVAISEYLKNNSTLQELDISHNQVSDNGVTNISKSLQINTALQMFLISRNNISYDEEVPADKTFQSHYKDDGIVTANKESINEAYIKKSALQKLNMSCNNISSKGVIALSNYLKNNTLQELTISWNDNNTPITILGDTNRFCNVSNLYFGNVGAILISAFLFQKERIQKLDISYNNISDDGTVAISEYLSSNNTLQQLNLSHNQVSSLGITNMSTALLTNTTLQILDISHNNISDDGTIAIIRTLHSHCRNNSIMGIANNEMINEGCITKSALQKLNMSYNKISSKGIVTLSDHLKTNITLQELMISWNDCENLIVLDGANILCNMSGKHFGDVGTALVSSFLWHKSNIQKLDISYNNISDDGTVAISEYLSSNNTLQQLDLSHNQVSSLGIINMSTALLRNTTLQILDISHNNISDDGTIAIIRTLHSHCRNNSIMGIANNEMINEGCIIKSALQKLNMSYNNISSKGIVTLSDHLKTNITLQELMISWNDCENLIVLDGANILCNMSGKHFGDVGTALVSSFLWHKSNIQKLDISHNNISDDGVVAISECLKHNRILQELNVSYNKITSKGIVEILRIINSNSPLHTLNLTHNIVTKSQLMIIYNVYEKCTHMPSVQISYNEIADNSQNLETTSVSFEKNLKIFDQSTATKVKFDIQNERASYKMKALCFCAMEDNSVKKLDISSHHITNKEAKIIAKALQGNRSLQKLDISNNNMCDDGAVAIIKSLENNSTLQELDISSNNIPVEGIAVLGDCLKNTTLHKLTISWNGSRLPYVLDGTNTFCNMCGRYLTNTGATLISAFLFQNHVIQKLDLSRNNLSDDGAVAISECLKSNKSLQQLDISHNQISSYGIINISKALLTNITLQKLSISHNYISDDVAVYISECLKHNKTLKVLDISNNEITEGIKIIASSMQENTTLLKLFLHKNNIFDDGVVAISECLTMNNTLEELSLSWNSQPCKSLSFYRGSQYNANKGRLTRIAEAMAVNTGLHTLDLSSQCFRYAPVPFTMTLLVAMEHNHTMMRLVLPKSVDMEEVNINRKLGNINKERIMKGIKTLSIIIKEENQYPT